MALLNFGDLNQKLIALKQTEQTLQHMFMVQCYPSGIDPTTVDIDTFNFAAVSDYLASLATSLISVRGHIADTEQEIIDLKESLPGQ